MFYLFLLCTLILTYFFKNKSTIKENVICIFCIICHVIFCLFFIILYYSLFFRPFSLFFKYPSKFYRFIENKEIKKTFIFLISLFFIVICLINLTICSPSLHKPLLYHIMIFFFFFFFFFFFATPHKTIASIGFILNLRSSTNAITKNMIISTHTFWRIRFTVPSMKNAEIKIVTPALAIIDTTAGLRDASVPWSKDIFRYFI